MVPANASFATLDFDVWYNTEDDPDFNLLAYDGFFLRIADQTLGRTSRSCLAEALPRSFPPELYNTIPSTCPVTTIQLISRICQCGAATPRDGSTFI